jgi:xanthine/uracil permease
MPVWLPVAVLGGVGALMFAVIAIGGARSRNRV